MKHGYYCDRRSAKDWRKAKLGKRFAEVVAHAKSWDRRKKKWRAIEAQEENLTEACR